MSPVMTASKPATKSTVETARGWLSPLNLHFAGLGLLVLVNVYLLAHMAFLWQSVRSNDATAMDQEKISLKTAEVAAQPLRGLDAKLDRSTGDADKFYKERLPDSDSQVAAELGALTKKQNVRFVRGAYIHKPILEGSAGELTQVQIDASFSGDYRPLVQFINSLERDKMFFVIDSVNLSGQQSGTVNLRLQLKTYERGRVAGDNTETAEGDANAGSANAGSANAAPAARAKPMKAAGGG